MTTSIGGLIYHDTLFVRQPQPPGTDTRRTDCGALDSRLKHIAEVLCKITEGCCLKRLAVANFA